MISLASLAAVLRSGPRRGSEFLGFLRSGTIAVAGDRSLTVPRVEVSRLAWNLGREGSEPWNAHLYAAFAQDVEDPVFVDIGANVGQTLVAVLSSSPNWRYVGFEPQAEAAAEAQRLIVRNELKRAEVFVLALADVAGMADLGFRKKSDQSASIAHDYRPSEFHVHRRRVFVDLGDAILPRLGVERPRFIKVDVEGAELEVLTGLYRTLAVERPALQFEVLPDRLLSTGEGLPDEVVRARHDRHQRLERLLDDLDFAVFRLSMPRSVSRVDTIRSEQSSYGASNFLAVANETVSQSLERLRRFGFTVRT